MAPGRSPYVERHLQQTLSALAPPPGARLLEVGCGMGRFSLLLAERGYQVTGLDISPDLLAVLRRHDPDGRVTTVCCDATEADRHVDGPFDGAVGFFALHHLRGYVPLFRALMSLLAPGAGVAFCEPNAWNPLFYLQILFTPTMTFRGDGGVARMRRGVIAPALAQAGFGELALARYGLLPPQLANQGWAAAVEARLERFAPLRRLLAFQVLSAHRPEASTTR